MNDINQNFKLISVKELLDNNYVFNIPSFQRGYRWQKEEVENFFTDLWEFSTDEQTIYLLQPLVVYKQDKNKYTVLDGQQRLTTLRILLSLLNIEKSYALEYSSRQKTNKIDFNDLKNLNWKDSPDHFYIYNAYKLLDKYLSKIDKNKLENFTKILSGSSVQFIWYEPIVNPNNKELENISFFDRFNKGKIPLTSSELIKALFVLDMNEEAGTNDIFWNAKNNLLITQWDQLEHFFQDDDFFHFLFHNKNYINRIDALFDFVTDTKYDPNKPLTAYYCYQKKYKEIAEKKKEKGNQTEKTERFADLWENEILKGFDILLKWFENVTYYNYIGWLTYCGKSVYDIKKELKDAQDEDEIKKKLYQMIVAQFKQSKTKNEPIDLDSLLKITYEDNKEIPKRLLLLFNIQLYITAGEKFPFAKYDNDVWDLEHISSQHESLTTKKDRNNWKEYAEKALRYIIKSSEKNKEDPEISELLNQLQNSNNFNEIYDKIGKYFEKKDGINPDNKHNISNLVLLDSHTNRSYGNAPFPYKRQRILENDQKGHFVPLGTKNVFLHYYTAAQDIVPNSLYWVQKDRQCYEEKIRQELQKIINEITPIPIENEQNATDSHEISLKDSPIEQKDEIKAQAEASSYTFKELLAKYEIQIPSIQREYAYGREDENTKKKRSEFLNFLIPAITEDKKIHLDFIYGYYPARTNSDKQNKNILEPLDGQQRLTTLFLLHWLVSSDNSILLNENSKEPLFSYKTRPSATAFCKAISNRKAKDLIEKWKNLNADIPFDKFLLNQNDWLMWSWRKDPTVKSMLTMLRDMTDSLYKNYDSAIDEKRLSNITFDLLDLKKLSIKEDWYVKMNARGKQLSEFDLKKSQLETDIQSSNWKKEDIADWRQKVDGIWLDYFWKKYAPAESNYTECEKIETNYLHFWTNIENLYKKLNQGKDKTPDYTVDRIYQSMSSLIYEKFTTEDGGHKCVEEISTLLTDINFFLPGNKNNLFGTMCDENLPNLDICAMFLGMLLFTNEYKDLLQNGDNITCNNFKQYMRMVHNICSNDNRQNRIDKDYELQKIYDILKIILSDFKNSHKREFNVFLSEYDVFNKAEIDDITKSCLEEERQKANLRCKSTINLDWNTSLNKAEEHQYLQGQLRCLLQWSRDEEGNIVKTKFDEYYNYFCNFYSLFEAPDELLYGTLLSFKEYTTELNTLYTLDHHRDYSWKRAMRDSKENNAEIIKQFIDKWKDDKSSPNNDLKLATNDIKSYSKYLIRSNINKQNGWYKWIIYRPKILTLSQFKRLLKDSNEHYYLLSKMTKYSAKSDIFLLALADSLFPRKNQSWTAEFNNKKFEIKVLKRGKNKNRLFIDNKEYHEYNFNKIKDYLINEGFPKQYEEKRNENNLSFEFKTKTYNISTKEHGKYQLSKEENGRKNILTKQSDGKYILQESNPNIFNNEAIEVSADTVWKFLIEEGLPLEPYQY